MKRIEELADKLINSPKFRPSEIMHKDLEDLDKPGVYVWWWENDDENLHRIIYVGRTGKHTDNGSRCMRKRLAEHLGGGSKEKTLGGQPIQRWVAYYKKLAKPGKDAKDWMRNNLKIQVLHIPDDPDDIFWKTRALLEHFLIAKYEPEVNLVSEKER